MRKIIVYDVEGLISSKSGYEETLYTFAEMISFKDYDMDELEWDRIIEESDRPVGWVHAYTVSGLRIFVPVYEWEKWEEVHKCQGNCVNCTCKH